MPNQIDTIALYGSVARGEANQGSDVDILVISPTPKIIKEGISSIRSELIYEGGFSFFISLTYLSREELHELVQKGSSFISNILAEGVILYDNGTFSRECHKTTTARR